MQKDMTEKRVRVLFLGILLIGVMVSIAISIVNGNISRTRLTQWGDDAGQYNATALSLLHNGSFHDSHSLFFGRWQKGPGYPVFLAFTYAFLGERPASVWIVHMVVWLASLVLTWRISRRFLEGEYALIPVLMLALYWGVAVSVISINSDLIALFLVLLYVWAFSRYRETPSVWFAVLQGFTIGYIVLTKPIVLYAVPVLFLLFLFLAFPQKVSSVVHGVLSFVIAILMISAWSLYNYNLLGTYQLGSGALTLMHRADDVNLSGRRISAFLTASAFGDYIADKLYPGYAVGAEPFTAEADEREKKYWALQLPDKTNEYELQQEQYRIAYSLIGQHPIKFFLTSFIYVLRLNSPVNHRGVEMVHTFVGTKDHIPDSLKVTALVSIRFLWYVFLGAVFYAFWKVKKDWSSWGLILFLVVYFNGMYALASHAEARYIVPILPFYFLFAVVAFKRFLGFSSTANHV